MKDLDLKNEKLGKLFLSYALPAMLVVCVFSLYSLIDVIFIAQNCEAKSLAAVEMSSPVLSLFSCFSIIIGGGTSTFIGILLGNNDNRFASRVFTLALFISTVLGIVFALITIAFIRPISMLLGSDENTFSQTRDYLITSGVFAPFYIISGLFLESIATVGKPMLSMIGNLIIVISNIGFDYLFIVVLKWSAFGAALASGISALCGCVFTLFLIINKKSILKISYLFFDWKIIWKIIYNGLSEGITVMGIGVISLIYNLIIMRTGGAELLSSFTVAITIINYFGSLLTGAAQGLNPIVSTNFGAGNMLRVKNSIYLFIIYETVFGIVISTILFLFKNSLLNLFDISEASVAPNIINAYLPLLIFTPYCSLIITFFTAINDAKTSAILSVVRTIILRIITIIVVYLVFGIDGLWYGAAISEMLSVVMCFSALKFKMKNIKNNSHEYIRLH